MAGKRTPQNRWDDRNLEAFQRLKAEHGVRLQRWGLRIMGRSSTITVAEWWDWARSPGTRSTEWAEFSAECRRVAAQYGVSGPVVKLALLVRGYRLDPQDGFSLEYAPPKISIVTDVDPDGDALFLGWLIYYASRGGVEVQSKGGRFVPSIGWGPPDRAMASGDRPTLAAAFRVRVEIPPSLPHELAAEWGRHAASMGDELARQLGYPLKRRMRARSVARRD